jgi:integrase
LLATPGLRRGEALGLRWRDIDLGSGRASIRQTVIAIRHTPTLGTPKTAKGRRTVTFDAATVAALREHRRMQAESGFKWAQAGQTTTRVRPSGSPHCSLAIR